MINYTVYITKVKQRKKSKRQSQTFGKLKIGENAIETLKNIYIYVYQ